MNIFKHIACRNTIYAKTGIKRFTVPDELVPWEVKFDTYQPPFFESPGIIDKPWADPKIHDPEFQPKFNAMDGDVNRVSHIGPYKVVNGMPLNPFGRTGISGRGILGRFGVNHAADPIVSTWKRDSNNAIVKHHEDKKPILIILCIKRRDTQETALPGGMVDAGEKVSTTLKREFIEECMNGKIQEFELDEFFKDGIEIYKGYIDDPRNTDNAWMESSAVNFHDEDGTFLSKLKYEAGDDAASIFWIEADRNLKLYANHIKLIEATAKLRNAHF